MQRFLSLLIAAAVVVVLTASSGTASTLTRRFASNDGAASVSANWSGYALQDVNAAGLQFTSVTGTWKVPVTTCTSGSRSSAAFWVGLGGSSDSATGLEQTGTGADCNGGTARYYAWYEILPAAAVEVPLKVKPGDQITTSVNVNGTTVLVQIKNRTRKTSFTKALQVAVPDLSSAEWIAEAPSACTPAAGARRAAREFGSMTSHARRQSPAPSGHDHRPDLGERRDHLIPQTRGLLCLPSAASTAGAKPGAISADGRSFAVSWLATAAP